MWLGGVLLHKGEPKDSVVRSISMVWVNYNDYSVKFILWVLGTSFPIVSVIVYSILQTVHIAYLGTLQWIFLTVFITIITSVHYYML